MTGGDRELTYALPEAHLIVSLRGEIVVANPAAAALIGQPMSEMEGRQLADVIGAEAGAVAALLRAAQVVRTLIPGALAIRGENGQTVRIRCDGALIRPQRNDAPALVLLRLAPAAGSGNRFLLLTQRIDDLTREVRRRRALESEREAMLAAERELRQVFEEQATELEAAQAEAETALEAVRDANNALQATLEEATRARATADHANEAKSAFMATMSHELRTPLNAIGGYADLLLEGVRGPLTEDQRADLRRLRRAAAHLLGLINNVLDFAKLEAGRVQFIDEPVRVDDIVATAASMVEPQAIAKGVAFDHVASPKPVTAFGDSDKILQIVLNLLSNAIRFTRPGGRVTVSAATREGGGIAEIRVGDTGRGIPREQLTSIFEPFVQVGRKLSGENEGVGLGLAISRELARGMQGDVTADSVDGEGSTFCVTLPAAY